MTYDAVYKSIITRRHIMKTMIGIDIGGTHVRLGMVTQHGKVTLQEKIVVGAKRSPQYMLALLEASIQKLKTENPSQRICAISMGVPGIVNPDKKMVHASPHYPLWKNFEIGKKLESQIKLNVFVDNDANMIALGEAWMGAAKSWHTFLMLTLGTGIGGAMVINSKIFHGTRGFAGEFGHMVLDPQGPPCPCGSRGCFETFASASALQRMIATLPGISPSLKKEKTEKISSELAKLARLGDPKAKGLYEKLGTYLGMGVASLINVTGIQNIILGGGLMGAFDIFKAGFQKELKKRIYPQTFAGINVRKAQLGDLAGIVGSARMGWDKFFSASS